MADENDVNLMEWTAGQQLCSIQFTKNVVAHSTPIMFRAAPTASPNLSKINRPIEDKILALIAKFKCLKLD